MENLHEMTAHELSALIKSKQVSSVEVTRAFLDRIQKVEDKVESLVTITEENALKMAEDADKKLAAGETLGTLAGIPYIAKDNICTKDIKTTCSSKMLHNFVPPYNATVVEKLDAESGVLIGKANMDEFAMGSSTETSYFKKTKNPHKLSCVPGGSSGGSAASVAADEAAFSLGSDTGGSIRQPASFCGVVGFKPTYGMVSRFGLVAFASSLDQIGPITKDVTDCAHVLNAITGHDAKDSTSVNYDKNDFTKALNADVRGMKIGIPKEYMSDATKPEIRETVMKAARQYEAMGAEVSECSLPMMPYALAAYYLISSAEASSNLARYDGVRYGFRAKDCDRLEDLYFKTRSQGFGDEVKRRIMLGTFVLSSGYYDAYYKKAQQVRTLIKQDFDKVFEKYDFLISPVSPITAWEIGNNNMSVMEVYAADVCTVSINIAGLPGMSVPCGTDAAGLPIGVQLIGKPFGDAKLVQGGYALEQSGVFPKIKASLGGAE